MKQAYHMSQQLDTDLNRRPAEPCTNALDRHLSRHPVILHANHGPDLVGGSLGAFCQARVETTRSPGTIDANDMLPRTTVARSAGLLA